MRKDKSQKIKSGYYSEIKIKKQVYKIKNLKKRMKR